MYKELREKKNDLMTRAEDVLKKAKAEKRELTEEEAKELEEIRDSVRKIIETLKLDDDFRELGDMEEKKEDGEKPKEENPMTDEQKTRALEKKEREAFEAYVRGVVLNTRNDPDPVNMTKTANGAVIPTTIANRIIKKVYDICPILERSSKYNVKGKLDLPYYGETAEGMVNVDYQTEFTAITSNVGSFGSISLTGFLAGALTLISRSLINNAQFDITGFIVDHMAYAIKRFIEKELLNGTVGKVTGLSTLSNGITAAAQNAITADEIIRLHDKVKDEFQSGAIWIMSPATRTAIRLLKSTTGYYLLNDDVSSPFGTTLLGKPVYVSDNMPDIEAGKNVIFYGDMKGLATKFNEDINIEVLREKYADMHAVGVVGWFEFDSKVEDAQKIAKLTMASA